MNTENTKKLLKKYPKIFIQHTWSIKDSAMPWLFECGDGWYKIIDLLCELLQWDIDENKHHQIEATQVKEKYGGLRFYTNGEDDKQHGLICFAQRLSEETCEECGSMEDVTQTKGWICSLCPTCMKVYKNKRGLK